MSSPSKVITSCFPLRRFSPSMFARASRAKFYIQPRFIDPEGLEEAISEAVSEAPSGYPASVSIDLYILLAFDDKAIKNFRKGLQESPREVLCAIPHNPGDFNDLIQELEAVLKVMGKTSGAMKGDTISALRDKAFRYLNHEGLSFFWSGEEIFSKGTHGRNLFYSTLLAKLFPGLIPFPLGMSRREREKAVLEALAILLDVKKPLTFPKFGGAPFNRLLGEFLEKGRFCEKVVDSGAYRQFELKETVPGDSPVKGCWALLESSLLSAPEEDQLSSLFRKLQAPPFGMPFHVALLLLGVFWRAHNSLLRLFDKAGGEKRREMEVNPQNLLKILREPKGKEVAGETAGDGDRDYVAGLGDLLGKKTDSAKDAYLAFSGWLQALSPLVRDIASGEAREPNCLFRIFREPEGEEGFRDALFKKLPPCMNVEEFDWRSPIQRDELFQKLRDEIRRIEESVSRRREKFLNDLGSIFEVDKPKPELLLKKMKTWLASKENEMVGVTFDADAKGLINALSNSGKAEDLLFKELPGIWNMEETSKWEKDRYLELFYRIWAAKLEIDYCKLKSFAHIAGGSDPRDYAKTMIIKYLDVIEQDAREKVFRLLDLSEKLYLG